MSGERTLRVREIVEATRSTRIVRLDLDGGPFVFRAGQVVLIGMHGQGSRRPYSLASSPADANRDGYLEILVKLDSSGGFGPHLDGARPGAAVDVAGPFGSFVFPEAPPERHVLFVAGGTGIAPLRAMIHQALQTGFAGRLALLYSARSPLDFSYATELRELGDRGTINLRLTVTREAEESWQNGRGRIDRDILASMIVTPATLCFVCGPPTMLEGVPPLLHQLGIDRDRIRTEEW